MIFKPDENLKEEHIRWLKEFGQAHVDNWKKLLRNCAEAAMCEAAVRRILAANDLRVEPAGDLAGDRKMPDFRCEREDGKSFLVEVACITIETVTKKTGLSHHWVRNERCSHLPMNKVVFDACRG
ncbi:MAG: hypothetical protein J7M21_03525, partial [Planctomycetes bacterium]|nr:hypothetical protein [Planctomycetota bacterium]